MVVVVAADNVSVYKSNNNNDDDDQMSDEFLRRYSSIQHEKMLFLRNSNVVDYVSYVDLNLNYS